MHSANLRKPGVTYCVLFCTPRLFALHFLEVVSAAGRLEDGCPIAGEKIAPIKSETQETLGSLALLSVNLMG